MRIVELQAAERVVAARSVCQPGLIGTRLQKTLALRWRPTRPATLAARRVTSVGVRVPDTCKPAGAEAYVVYTPSRKQHSEVHVQTQRTAEALNQCHRAALCRWACDAGLVSQMARDLAIDDPEHGPSVSGRTANRKPRPHRGAITNCR